MDIRQIVEETLVAPMREQAVGRTYLVFLDSHGEPLPITPRAWRPSIFRRAK